MLGMSIIKNIWIQEDSVSHLDWATPTMLQYVFKANLLSAYPRWKAAGDRIICRWNSEKNHCLFVTFTFEGTDRCTAKSTKNLLIASPDCLSSHRMLELLLLIKLTFLPHIRRYHYCYFVSKGWIGQEKNWKWEDKLGCFNSQIRSINFWDGNTSYRVEKLTHWYYLKVE